MKMLRHPSFLDRNAVSMCLTPRSVRSGPRFVQIVWCCLEEFLSSLGLEIVRGVSWSLLATVPKRKSRRSLDMNFLWNAEEGVWKIWKKSNGTERKRRWVKRTTTTQHTDDHAWME